MPIKSEVLALEGINIELEAFPGLINWHPRTMGDGQLDQVYLLLEG
ncbi:MAG: hypothetical protein CM15mP49_23930 [Actinomycetota bacterium]|nr:MAG: hypothetical protein CM15mP49_23930 [Actinomycetota bacterium]